MGNLFSRVFSEYWLAIIPVVAVLAFILFRRRNNFLKNVRGPRPTSSLFGMTSICISYTRLTDSVQAIYFKFTARIKQGILISLASRNMGLRGL